MILKLGLGEEGVSSIEEVDRQYLISYLKDIENYVTTPIEFFDMYGLFNHHHTKTGFINMMVINDVQEKYNVFSEDVLNSIKQYMRDKIIENLS